MTTAREQLRSRFNELVEKEKKNALNPAETRELKALRDQGVEAMIAAESKTLEGLNRLKETVEKMTNPKKKN